MAIRKINSLNSFRRILIVHKEDIFLRTNKILYPFHLHALHHRTHSGIYICLATSVFQSRDYLYTSPALAKYLP